MRRFVLWCSCLAMLVACGSSSTPEPAPTTAVPPSSVAPSSVVPAPPASAPPPSAPAFSGRGPALPGHLWLAHDWMTPRDGADLSSAPEGLTLDVDEATEGTADEIDAAPLVSLSAERPLDAPSPAAAMLAYAGTIGLSAGDGCHLGVARSLAPIVDDAPRAFAYTLVALCPVPSLDGVSPEVLASAAGEDLSAGEIGGVTLTLDFHRSLADVLTDGRVLALDAPGLDYVLLQTPSADDPTASLVEMHADDVGRPSAEATIAAFAGRPITIEEP